MRPDPLGFDVSYRHPSLPQIDTEHPRPSLIGYGWGRGFVAQIPRLSQAALKILGDGLQETIRHRQNYTVRTLHTTPQRERTIAKTAAVWAPRLPTSHTPPNANPCFSSAPSAALGAERIPPRASVLGRHNIAIAMKLALTLVHSEFLLLDMEPSREKVRPRQKKQIALQKISSPPIREMSVGNCCHYPIISAKIGDNTSRFFFLRPIYFRLGLDACFYRP